MPYDRAVCKHRHEAADMALRQCIRCNNFWASNAVGGSVITHYCPDCIPLLEGRVMTDDRLSVQWVDRLDRRAIESGQRASVEARMDELDAPPDEPLSWTDQYRELRVLGYPDWQIAKRFGISNLSLLRQLNRYGIAATPEFASLCAAERQAARQRQAS